MVKIKFSRVGRKNEASYKIVVGNAREKRETRFIDYLGSYSPFTKKFVIDQNKTNYWLSVGAQPTDTVQRLLIKNGLMQAQNNYKKLYSIKPKKKSQERKDKKSSKEIE
jgi:small subunit ribosomal protein S16